MSGNIPAASTLTFSEGIRHPSLYLWDAWSYLEDDTMHLYCLAISRMRADGSPLSPSERNDYPFHIRHFCSRDEGRTWRDHGCFLDLATWTTAEDYRTVWSGSVKPLPDGRKLVAFTGIEDVDDVHIFAQNIHLATSMDGQHVDQVDHTAISSPRLDWQEIIDKGYYLDKPERLGHRDGEGGGPILAWRDPYIFIDREDISLFWGGKVSPTRGALVRADITMENGRYVLKNLYAPITVPDAHQFTQLELPKVLHDAERGVYYLLISTCHRLYEGQSDDEVDKCVTVYRSPQLEGPWISFGRKILGKEQLFGPTVLKADFENNRLLCIAPYTDAVDAERRLTFSPAFYLHLDTLEITFLH